MAEIRNLGDAFSWPVARLADCFGVHRQTLTKRIKESGLAPAGTYRGNPTYAISDIAALMHAPEQRAGQDPDEMTPQDRKAWFESEKTRRLLEEKDRTLIPAAEVEEAVATGVAALAQGMRSIPDIVERRTACDAAIVAEIESVIDAEMDALADKLTLLGPDSMDD